MIATLYLILDLIPRQHDISVFNLSTRELGTMDYLPVLVLGIFPFIVYAYASVTMPLSVAFEQRVTNE